MGSERTVSIVCEPNICQPLESQTSNPQLNRIEGKVPRVKITNSEQTKTERGKLLTDNASNLSLMSVGVPESAQNAKRPGKWM